MIIGVPREIKSGEQRVALTPPGARALVEGKHRVVVERGAGLGSSIRDEEYTREGATLASVEEVWDQTELILKVKEPLPEEYAAHAPGPGPLHLPAPGPRARASAGAPGRRRHRDRLRDRAARPTAALPLLAPMSEVAGRLSVQEGAFFLPRRAAAAASCWPACPGCRPATSWCWARARWGSTRRASRSGLGADVSILDINLDRLRAVDDLFHGRVITLVSNSFNISQVLRRADLLVGAVLVTGALAPVLVTKEMVASMKEGSVIVDVAVDQGGTVETIHPTTLLDPIYLVSGVVHYGVANMPALVPRTSTFALTNATLPYVLELAGKGLAAALRQNALLTKGVNIWRGRVVHPAVARRSASRATPLDDAARLIVTSPLRIIRSRPRRSPRPRSGS